jgi:hypothetical protein
MRQYVLTMQESVKDMYLLAPEFTFRSAEYHPKRKKLKGYQKNRK